MAGSGPNALGPDATGAPQDALYCVNHPQTETLIRCSRCLDPICQKCAVRTPVGLRCRKCASVGRSPLYILRPHHYVLAAGASLLASLVAGILVTQVGFLLIALLLAIPIGGLIAEVTLRTIRGKRGRAVQAITVASIIFGALVGPWLWGAFRAGTLAALPGNPLLYLARAFDLTTVIYVVLAAGAAIARLR